MTTTEEVRALKLQILKGARALISKPENWAKGSFAYLVPSTELQYITDSHGQQSIDTDLQGGLICRDTSDEAQCWCPLGAISNVMCGLALYSAVVSLLDAEMNYNIPTFNDHKDTTHEMVLAAFDRAIAKLEAPGDALAVPQIPEAA